MEEKTGGRQKSNAFTGGEKQEWPEIYEKTSENGQRGKFRTFGKKSEKFWQKSVPLLCHHERRACKPAKASLGLGGLSAQAVLENGPRKQVCPFSGF